MLDEKICSQGLLWGSGKDTCINYGVFSSSPQFKFFYFSSPWLFLLVVEVIVLRNLCFIVLLLYK